MFQPYFLSQLKFGQPKFQFKMLSLSKVVEEEPFISKDLNLFQIQTYCITTAVTTE